MGHSVIFVVICPNPIHNLWTVQGRLPLGLQMHTPPLISWQEGLCSVTMRSLFHHRADSGNIIIIFLLVKNSLLKKMFTWKILYNLDFTVSYTLKLFWWNTFLKVSKLTTPGWKFFKYLNSYMEHWLNHKISWGISWLLCPVHSSSFTLFTTSEHILNITACSSMSQQLPQLGRKQKKRYFQFTLFW